MRRSRHTVPVLHPVGYSYFATLRKKLHWNEHPSQDDASNHLNAHARHPLPTHPSMLRHLSIRDFVIVAALDLEFDSGFTVFSGETGAGKSILIDALALALGARGDASVVRTGEARADITAEFATHDAGRRAGSTSTRSVAERQRTR